MDVNSTSLMSLSNFTTPQSICNLSATNIETKTLNNTSVENIGITYISEAGEETTDLEVIKKIQYYKNLHKRIWRISLPILLGK